MICCRSLDLLYRQSFGPAIPVAVRGKQGALPLPCFPAGMGSLIPDLYLFLMIALALLSFQIHFHGYLPAFFPEKEEPVMLLVYQGAHPVGVIFAGVVNGRMR